MDDNFAVTLLQPDVIWERVYDNLEMYSHILESVSDKPDLILLPEMFTTGFSMNTLMAERSGDQTMQWMEKWSARSGCVVAGSIIASDQGKFYNRFIWMRPDGSYSFYDKRHLFRMADEHKNFTSGRSRLITGIKGWKICPMICYDLRFPVWSRNRCINSHWDYDMLIYVANWPATRNHIWTTLLSARAIENQAYAVGVNRVGTDGNNINYSGNSMVVDSLGNIAGACMAEKAECKTIRISGKHLIECRSRLGVYRDWDRFSIEA